MFREPPTDNGNYYRLAVIGLLLLSAAALAITVWVEYDFLREQKLVDAMIRELPSGSTASARQLAGDLRWQFRLIALVLLNLVVTGIAVMLLWRAYLNSQESLRDIKALAGDILSSMEQGVITTDLDGTVTSINRRGLDLLSPDADCVGRPLREFNAVPLETFRQDWLREKSAAMTRDFQTGNGLTVRAFCQDLNDYQGREIGNVLQLRDVSERVLIEDRMRRMERYMGLGSLAAGLHHEIRNPLAALSLHVQLLEEQLASGDAASDEIGQMLSIIKSEVARVGRVLEGFRDFASVGKLQLEPIHLGELVARQLQLIAPQAEGHGIVVESTIADTLSDHRKFQVSGDRVRLEQVLLNLLVNAMEAMPDGGTLTVGCRADDKQVVVAVADTGCGIPEALCDKIVDPYFTTKSTGTGLGLALCDKIIRQHSGTLDFQTSPQGTTFQFSLPVLPPNQHHG